LAWLYAFFVGSHVSETVRKGIIDTQSFNDQPMLLAYGMLAAMLAAAAWLQFASYYGWPISTTHSIFHRCSVVRLRFFYLASSEGRYSTRRHPY
jgi:phosphate/sulfate permease